MPMNNCQGYIDYNPDGGTLSDYLTDIYTLIDKRLLNTALVE
jgi:hypothetical protein